MFLRLKWITLAFAFMASMSSPALAWEGCYAFDQPFTGFQGVSPPVEIEVYYDSTFSNAPSIGGLTVATAKNILKSIFSRMPGESGANFTYRVMTTAPPTAVCDENSPVRVKPYLIIHGDPDDAFCCAGESCGACAGAEKKPGTLDMKCGRLHFRLDVNHYYYSVTGNEFMRLAQHEIGHTLRLGHQNWATCLADHPENLDDVVTTCKPCPGSGVVRRHLTRADREYLRSDYGRTLRELYEYDGLGFGPAAWTGTALFAPSVIGPVSTTDGNDEKNGYGYNTHVGGLDDEMRAYLYESGWLPSEVVSQANSYYRSDLTRSIGQNPNKWLAVFPYNDSRESGIRDIRVSEKTFGVAGWAESAFGANLENPHAAVAYDPLSQRFLLVTLTNADEIQVSSRTFAGPGGWPSDFVRNGGAGGPTITAYDGADVACSAWANNDGHNCVVVYVTASASSSIKFVPFHMSGSSVLSGAVTAGANLLGISRPSVTANPVNLDPKFMYAFSQGGATIFTRLQNRNSSTWSGGTPVNLPSLQWAPAAGLGSYFPGIGVYTNQVVSQ